MSEDYEDRMYSLDDVCDRLDNIEAAIKEANELWSAASLLWVVLVVFGVYSFVSDAWNSKWRLALWFEMDSSQVTIQEMRNECKFFHAPLGIKDCHYEKSVMIVKSNRFAGQSISFDNGSHWLQTSHNDNGTPLVSQDDGQTWSTENVPGPLPVGITVTWEKMDE